MVRNFLSYERFRFFLKVTGTMVLPPYKGSVFRGAFGSAFRRIVCAKSGGDCMTCVLRQQCLYVSFFEPPPPPDYPDAARFSHAPPPYVLNPPLTNRQSFHSQEILNFDLVLMGRAIEVLPYFVYTFVELGRRGLGRERGKYDLIRVDLLRDGQAIQIYDGQTQTLSDYPPPIGFDPYLGVYHQPHYGHATLASDLIEEFHAPLIDRLTLSLINNRVFKEDDFFFHSASGNVYLNDSSRKRYFFEYEQFVTRPMTSLEEKPESNFRRLFRRQAERLNQTITAGTVYCPHKFCW